MIKRRIKNKSLRHEFDASDILKVAGCKVSPIKIFKLNETPKSHPTA